MSKKDLLRQHYIALIRSDRRVAKARQSRIQRKRGKIVRNTEE